MKINIITTILSTMLLLATSCSESLDDINISPNTLPDTEVDIKFVLTGVLSESAKITTAMSYEWGELSAATQYLQRDFTSYEENNYQWGAKDFSNYYQPLKDSQYIYKRAETEKTDEVKNYYQAVTLIIKSYHFGFMTSAFGDVPYNKALQAENGGDEFFKPAYDSQKDVFIGILNDLKEANTLLTNVDVCTEAIDSDVLYSGDGQKWRKLANSLRLRFYMRLSEKSDSDINVSSEIAAIVNNASEFPILENNDDNAVVSFIGTDSDNSWSGGALNYSNRSEFYRRKPSATIVNDLIALNDPRLTKWVKPVDIQLEQGTTNQVVLENNKVKRYTDIDINAINSDDDLENDINTSLFVGLPVALSAPNDFNLGAATISEFQNDIVTLDENIYLNAAANPHASYLTDMYSENSHELVKSILMTASEVKFLLAEASSRGYISGDAYTYYKQGIELSFDQYQITDGDTEAVYDEANNNLIAFNQAEYIANAKQIYDAARDKLAPIIHQKWIALWLTNESWFDFRRTGYPDLNSNIISGTKGQQTPVRFLYTDPYNETNMLEAIQNLSPTTNDQWSKMWLLQ
ncbi:SusD/RagB family nutrient-binding outer membrane lipoprotein [Wenyingzhuangia sp. 2_MG-2023]|uniref:SusD/RagB family nutrient-binding outer membrane lipoprotein n=1 Tax=Wenyingzhuangia sp. 2_MG-2023 TaxID=3062639 RepID=UPI0026E3C731|nr:SusD/RagB family nutrient-binding outer membrane lipoprotein [Wenyingzhuangia sp. 2_MG-2023]MDO6738780.1 SusD/RagB family nutrient-binding outer membrane lipoprotein [Wenyingzhuangia sp. 2_MG-2023]